jgi:hypothetical protein
MNGQRKITLIDFSIVLIMMLVITAIFLFVENERGKKNMMFQYIGNISRFLWDISDSFELVGQNNSHTGIASEQWKIYLESPANVFQSIQSKEIDCKGTDDNMFYFASILGNGEMDICFVICSSKTDNRYILIGYFQQFADILFIQPEHPEIIYSHLDSSNRFHELFNSKNEVEIEKELNKLSKDVVFAKINGDIEYLQKNLTLSKIIPLNVDRQQ